MRFSMLLGGLLLATTAAPALAQDTAPPRPLQMSGGATLVSDYRFRGLSQSGGDPAIQGTINLNHESGFYAGVWASSIDGGPDASTPALTNYGGAEVDLYGGFTKSFASGIGVDGGLLYYLYPDRRSGVNTDYFEPYASVSYTIGPVAAKAGLAYAWGGQRGLDVTSGKDDNLYTYAEASAGVPTTPITLKAHLGYTNGALGRVNPTIADDDYIDYSLSAEAVKGPLKLGLSFVDTDIGSRQASGVVVIRRGRDATLLGYVGVSF